MSHSYKGRADPGSSLSRSNSLPRSTGSSAKPDASSSIVVNTSSIVHPTAQGSSVSKKVSRTPSASVSGSSGSSLQFASLIADSNAAAAKRRRHAESHSKRDRKSESAQPKSATTAKSPGSSRPGLEASGHSKAAAASLMRDRLSSKVSSLSAYASATSISDAGKTGRGAKPAPPDITASITASVAADATNASKDAAKAKTIASIIGIADRDAAAQAAVRAADDAKIDGLAASLHAASAGLIDHGAAVRAAVEAYEASEADRRR